MSLWRRQVPVYSPLTAGAVLSGLMPGDPRPEIAALLRDRFAGATVILTDSGTAALTLALADAARRRPGLPCVLPAFGCYDLATAAIGAGVSVRLYDVEPATLGPNLTSLRQALAGGAAAVVAAHLYGVPSDVGLLHAEAARVGAVLIDDAAQGSGATFDGRPLGGFGAYGILSFGRGKGVTGGGGGALLVHDGDVAPGEMPRVAPNESGAAAATVRLAAQYALARPALYAVPRALPGLRLGETVYHAPSTPQAMSAHQARVLRATIPLEAGEVATRRRHAQRFAEVVRPRDPAAIPQAPAVATSGFLRFPVLMPKGVALDPRSAARLGIAPSYPMPLSELAPLRPLLAERMPTPGAALLAERLVTLPTHSRLSAHDLRELDEWLRILFA